MKMIAPLLLYLSLISRHHQVLRDSHRNDIEDTTEVNEATIYENRTEENVAQFTVTDKDFSTEKYQESSKADDSSSFEKLLSLKEGETGYINTIREGYLKMVKWKFRIKSERSCLRCIGRRKFSFKRFLNLFQDGQ